MGFPPPGIQNCSVRDETLGSLRFQVSAVPGCGETNQSFCLNIWSSLTSPSSVLSTLQTEHLPSWTLLFLLVVFYCRKIITTFRFSLGVLTKPIKASFYSMEKTKNPGGRMSHFSPLSGSMKICSLSLCLLAPTIDLPLTAGFGILTAR